MSKARKSQWVRLHELQPNQYADFFAQLAEKKRNAKRDGSPFYTCSFRDRLRTVAAVPVWSDSPLFEDCQANWLPGGFFKIRATLIESEKYGPQLDIEQIRPVGDRDRAEGFTELDFMERSRFDPEVMFTELETFTNEEIADLPLRQLVLKLLQEYAPLIKLLPGSHRTYYPFAGGWLEHTLAVARNCARLADYYRTHYPDLKPPLNRDLVIAGAILHDIGRVKELDTAQPGVLPRPGVDGELFGHLLLGRDMLREAARDVPDLNPELLRLLEHVVYTHLRLPEWGSPRLPAIPEVLIVHHADDLDAKLELYARCLNRDSADGPFTEVDPVLKRPLFKGRSV